MNRQYSTQQIQLFCIYSYSLYIHAHTSHRMHSKNKDKVERDMFCTLLQKLILHMFICKYEDIDNNIEVLQKTNDAIE